MTVTVKVDGLDTLLADLARAGEQLPPEARKITQKGALNIKTSWARYWSGLKHAPALSRAVTYDTRWVGSGVEAEIGPDKSRRQGALGNLVEYGSINNAPIPGGAPALAEEAPRYERYLTELALGLLAK
jgi:hypothetical protein